MTEGRKPPHAPTLLHRDWIDYLRSTRNDLEPPARSIEPEIGAVSAALAKEDALFVRMSGSGATCFGLFDTITERDRAAANLSSQHPNWYVLACTSIGGEEYGDGRHG
nr:hypothetical protein [Rhizobium gei]